MRDALANEGFAFVAAEVMRDQLEATGSLDDWACFAASWNDLGPDTYMADKGRYRKRRYAVFIASPADIQRQPHQPHYQSRDYNNLNGGIERWFDPILPGIGESASLQTILGFCHRLFGSFNRTTPNWHVEVHQFRIEARHGESGKPTPEGMHRDGVDYALVLLVARENIASGTTLIHRPDGQPLGAFTLARPFDTALLDDHRVYHGVTPVEAVDPVLPAYRDVLVVTFRAQ